MAKSIFPHEVETLDIIVPVFNEEQCLPELMSRLVRMREICQDLNMRVILVNDGSKDGSYILLETFAAKYPFLRVVNLSRNFGHQMAVTAGLDYADADYIAIIDADLQDPPELILDFVKRARSENLDIVYGKRVARHGETFFKKATAMLFYRLLRALCKVEIPPDTGDFRLIRRKVLKALQRMPELHRFIRGMVPWTGFRSAAFEYHRSDRFAGETKYPLKKMMKFALDAIFSFSSAPLRIATCIGLGMIASSMFGAAFLLYLRFFTVYTVPGITATILAIVLMGGFQILILGITGEYVGRIFEEVKRRPLYVVDNVINFSGQKDSIESVEINCSNRTAQ